MYGAAVRHFLHWLDLQGIAIRLLDDRVVRRFESIGAGAPGIRRSKRSTRLILRRGSGVSSDFWKIEDTSLLATARPISASILPPIWPRLPIRCSPEERRATTDPTPASSPHGCGVTPGFGRRRCRAIERYAHHDCRCPVYRKRGKLVRSGTKRRRRCAQSFVEFLLTVVRDRTAGAGAETDPHVLGLPGVALSSTGERATRRSAVTGAISRGSRLCWASPRNGTLPS